MEELIRNALSYIPNYVGKLFRLVQGPKRFVERQFSRDEATLKDSLLFFALSILIAWLLESASTGHKGLEQFGGGTIFTFALAAAYGTAICLAWRIVKGDADAKSMFVVHFYYSGVVQLLAACWFMAAVGVAYRRLRTVHGRTKVFFRRNA